MSRSNAVAALAASMVIFSSSRVESRFQTSSSSPSWTNVIPDSNASTTLARREGAMVASGPMPDSVLVFGGCSSSCCYAPLSDLWMWQSGQWTNLTSSSSSSSSAPTGRLYHSGSYASTSSTSPQQQQWYMYGGADEMVGARSDFWLLQAQTYPSSGGEVRNVTWTLLDANAPPGARAAHAHARVEDTTSLTNDGSFVFYGGENETETLSDLWLYNATTRTWILLNDGLTNGPPGGRSGSSLTFVTDPNTQITYILLMGGTDATGDDHADVWAFQWTGASAQQQSTPWVCLGSATGGGENGNWPLERHGHSLWSSASTTTTTMIKSTSSLDVPLFYVFGGQHGGDETDPFVGDLWLFSATLGSGVNGTFALLQAGTSRPSPLQPVARGLGGMVLSTTSSSSAQSRYLYFGGFSGYDGGLNDMLHNDVWVFEG